MVREKVVEVVELREVEDDVFGEDVDYVAPDYLLEVWRNIKGNVAFKIPRKRHFAYHFIFGNVIKVGWVDYVGRNAHYLLRHKTDKLTRQILGHPPAIPHLH